MIEVLHGGLSTTVQDYPGRTGYWKIGIPPSGPMDSMAFRIANRLVGNAEGEAGLEITAVGPVLRFLCDTVIALTGAKLKGDIDGKEIPWWERIQVKKGSLLTLKHLEGAGLQCYMAVAGGIDVPVYLGSKSTFPFGSFGGYEGRPLKKDDCLRIGKANANAAARNRGSLRLKLIPEYVNEWEIGVIPGPHGSPDYFTAGDEELLYNTGWTVNYNSNRLGYRLEGPRPRFARENGGEGGNHPSNLIDYAYAVGTINFTGNMPIILTVDGPSLGGFVSMATIAKAELWKIGQARPDDIIHFRKMTIDEALELQKWQERVIKEIC